jgi:hypothetical protein
MISTNDDPPDVGPISSLLVLGLGYQVELFMMLWVRDLKDGKFAVTAEGEANDVLFTDSRRAAEYFVAQREMRRLGFDFEGAQRCEVHPCADARVEAENISALLARQVGYLVILDGLYASNLEDGDFAVGVLDGFDKIILEGLEEVLFTDAREAARYFVAHRRQQV